MQRHREGLTLSTDKNSPEFNVAAADGDDLKPETAQRLNYLTPRQLPRLRHRMSGFSIINCSFG